MGSGASRTPSFDEVPLLTPAKASLNADPGSIDEESYYLQVKWYHRCGAWWRRRQCGNRVPRWAIATCVGVLLVLLVVLAVLAFSLIIPRVLDFLIDDSTIEFDLIRLTQPQNNSLFLDCQGTLKVSALVAAVIKSFPLTVSYNDRVMGRTVLPDVTLSTSGKTPLIVSERMEITDMATFNQFGQDMIHAHTLSWRLTGSTSTEFFGLSYHVNFDKEVVIPVLDGLKNVKIEAFDLASSNETNINSRLRINIFNPSVVSIEPLGHLSMDIMYKGSLLALAHTAQAVNMSRGHNRIEMEATILPQNVTLFGEVITRYLRGQPCNVSAVASLPAATDIPLYQPTLANFTLDTVLEGMNSSLILGAEFTSLRLLPVNSTSASLSANVSIEINQLLGTHSPLVVEQVQLDIDLVYLVDDDEDHGHDDQLSLALADEDGGPAPLPPPVAKRPLVIGHLQTSMPVVPTAQKDGVVNITIEHEDLEIEGEHTTANFVRFIIDFIRKPTLQMKIVGSTDVRVKTAVSRLEASAIPVNNTVVLPGLSNLPDVKVLNFTVPRDAPTGGLELVIDLAITNPSLASFVLPTVNFGIFYEEAYLGYLNATDLRLDPGDNSFHFSGVIDPPPQNLAVASAFMSHYLAGQATNVSVRGLDAGNSSIGWLQKAVAGMALSTQMPGFANSSSLITDVEVRLLAVNFAADVDRTTANITVTAAFHSPFAVRQQVQSLSLYSEVLFHGSLISTFVLPMTPVEDKEGHLRISADLVPLSVTDIAQFAAFARELLLSNHTAMALRGHLLASSVATSIGVLNITDAPLDADIKLRGADQFKGDLEIGALSLVSGSASGLTIDFNVTVRNPLPNVGMDAGSLSMSILYEGFVVAQGLIPSFKLELGTSVLAGTGTYVQPTDPAGAQAARQFLSNFVMGVTMPVTLANGVTDVPLLEPAVSALSIATQVPGNTQPLIDKAEIKGVSLFAETLNVAIYVTNPFDTYMAIDYLDVNVSLSSTNELLGGVKRNLTQTNETIYVAAHGTAASAPLPCVIYSLGNALQALVNILLNGGHTQVNVQGDVNARIFNPTRSESYGVSITYAQQNIPTILYGS